MGNANSIDTNTTCNERTPEDLWWNPVGFVNNKYENKSKEATNLQTNPTTTLKTTPIDANKESNIERLERKKILDKELDDFKRNIHEQHEVKRRLINEKKQELINLRRQLELQKMINEELKIQLDKSQSQSSSSNPNNVESDLALKCDKYQELLKENEEQRKLIEEMKLQIEKHEEIHAKNQELRIHIAELQKEMQNVNAEVLEFESERKEYKTHVVALKDVIKVTKEMLNIRENQIQELKHKINVIEESLKDREMPLLADELRKEYERQLKNIRSLRALYEERERVDRREKQNLIGVLDDTKKLLQNEEKKNKENEERIEVLEKENWSKYDTIKSLESQLGLSKAECKELEAEMAVINQLFSQILLGFNNNQDVDLDNLMKLLEENHDLLSKIAINEESTEISAALPKTLLDLINQVNKEKPESETIKTEPLEQKVEDVKHKLETIVEETELQNSNIQLSSAEEIVQNLPKVWKVLIELLSHQCVPINTIFEETNKGNEHFCYKSIQTPNGPKLVLSVSKTFIRLKDLILEKKSLEKETNRLKHLNGHLETRLQDQEKRLEMVSKELSRTWHVVGKMQKQHQQLHTQEKILRYELAQKRKLLTELKEELEYCREKWVQARQMDTTTELQWKQLRKEFASRKSQNDTSVESGYSDDKSSSDEEQCYESKTLVPNADRSTISLSGNVTETSQGETIEVDESLVKNDESVVKSDEPPIKQEQEIKSNVQLTETNHVEVADVNAVTRGVVGDILVKENVVSTNDVNHSSGSTDKTDLVQSDERQSVSSHNEISSPSSSSVTTAKATDSNKFNLEEMLARREERLKRMEQQGKELVNKVTNTSRKSLDISNKLENLHEIYGDSSARNDSSLTQSDTKEDVSDDENQASSSRND